MRRKRKLIGGVKHVQIPCTRCGEPVWTSTKKASGMLALYVCDTCLEVKFDKTLGLTPAVKPLRSESRYHGRGHA